MLNKFFHLQIYILILQAATGFASTMIIVLIPYTQVFIMQSYTSPVAIGGFFKAIGTFECSAIIRELGNLKNLGLSK
ncbi:hypothetical protein BDB01DRAFT_772353 [Pilobolus umbonatus]|nr:hypothetical protein BDB01DRAFT_772353 [Pilobolus umbonatus]